MGLLTQLNAAIPTVDRDPSRDRWWASSAYASVAGQVVSPDRALTLSAVWAAVRILTSDLASIPLVLYRRDPSGRGRHRAEGHPLFDVLCYQPNQWQTALEFWEMLIGHLLLRGNAYAHIVSKGRDRVAQLIPIHPDRVTPERLPSGRVRFHVASATATRPTKIYTQDQIMHLRGFSTDGVEGCSVVAYAAQSFGVGLAADHYAGHFFGEGATPSAVLQVPGVLEEAEERRLRQSVKAYTAGAENAQGYLVLEEGITWQQIGIKPEDAQLLGTREFSIEEVARWFNLPVHKLRVNKQAQTFASVEAFNAEYVTGSLRPLAARIEQAVRRDLIGDPVTQTVAFLLQELLRANTKDRVTYYHTGVLDGWLSRNDVREMDGLNPGPPALDEYLEPLNMQPAGTESAAEEPPSSGAAPVALAPGDQSFALAHAANLVEEDVDQAVRAGTRCADDPAQWAQWVRRYWGRRAETLTRELGIPTAAAKTYCRRQARALTTHGLPVLDAWPEQQPRQLVALAAKEGSSS